MKSEQSLTSLLVAVNQNGSTWETSVADLLNQSPYVLSLMLLCAAAGHTYGDDAAGLESTAQSNPTSCIVNASTEGLSGVNESQGGTRTQFRTFKSDLLRLSAELELSSVAAGKFIKDNLREKGLHFKWVSALIYASENARFPTIDDRTEVCVLMARNLEGIVTDTQADERAVWTGIRRIGSLVPVERIGVLERFLRLSENPSVRQVALQSIANALEDEAPTDSSGSLVALVGQIVEETLKDNPRESAQKTVMLEAAVVAAVRLRHPHAELYLHEVEQLGLPRLTARVEAASRIIGEG